MDLTNQNGTLNQFNLPPEDYNDRGQVRVLRKRMIKKLLKYEYKAIFSWFWIALGVLVGATALTVCSFLLYKEEEPLISLIAPVLLYVYAIVGVTLTPLIISSVRYNKNFFKGQGYLTFSIPASPEEHLFAKHVSALSTFFLAGASALVSLAIVVIVGVFTFGAVSDGGTVGEEVKINFLGIIEGLFYTALIPVAIICGAGAFDCWRRKFTKKSQIFVRILIAYFALSTLETLLLTVTAEGMFKFLNTPLGAHLSSWFGIILLVGIIVFSVWYELRTLKKNLNLK